MEASTADHGGRGRRAAAPSDHTHCPSRASGGCRCQERGHYPLFSMVSVEAALWLLRHSMAESRRCSRSRQSLPMENCCRRLALVLHLVAATVRRRCRRHPDHGLGLPKCLPKLFCLGRLFFPKFSVGPVLGQRPITRSVHQRGYTERRHD